MPHTVEIDPDEMSRPRIPWGTVALVVIVALAIGGGVVRTFDYVFLAILVVLSAAVLVPGWARPTAEPVVKVRCGECRALNPEEASFCNACGKPL